MPPSDRPAGAFSDPDLIRRIVSALALVPIVVLAAVAGGPAFALFWLVASLAVLWEWNRLVLGRKSIALFAFEACVIASAVAVIHFLRDPWLGLVVVLIGMIAAASIARAGLRRWSVTGILYASAVVAGPVILRDDPFHGLTAILWLFAIVWGSDVGAYFAGRAIGGPKLWPRLSPKKTWSGFVGGLITGVVLGLAIVWPFGIPITWPLVLVSLAVAISTHGGDLFESAVKRRFAAKDAGSLIPGHGGAMDRLDGFLVAGSVAAVIGMAHAGVGQPAVGVLVWAG